MSNTIEPITNRTKKFSIEIIRYCKRLKELGVEYSLRDQLLRSGTSIGANVNEGQNSSSRIQFCRYYEIALRSADETKYWLDIIETGYNTIVPVALVSELIAIIKILKSIIIKLKANSNQLK